MVVRTSCRFRALDFRKFIYRLRMTHVYKQRRIVQDQIHMNHLLVCFGNPRTVPIDPELAGWKVTKEEGQSTLGDSCYPAIAL